MTLCISQRLNCIATSDIRFIDDEVNAHTGESRIFPVPSYFEGDSLHRFDLDYVRCRRHDRAGNGVSIDKRMLSEFSRRDPTIWTTMSGDLRADGRVPETSLPEAGRTGSFRAARQYSVAFIDVQIISPPICMVLVITRAFLFRAVFLVSRMSHRAWLQNIFPLREQIHTCRKQVVNSPRLDTVAIIRCPLVRRSI